MGTTGVGAAESGGRRPGWEGQGGRPTASAHSENDLRVNASAGERGFWRRWVKPASCRCRLQMPQPRTSYSTGLGLSFLTCNAGSQKLLHSTLGAELSHVGRAPSTQRAQRGEDVVLVLTALLGMQVSWWPDHRPHCHSQANSARGTQARPQVLEGQRAGERSRETTTQCPQGPEDVALFPHPGGLWMG